MWKMESWKLEIKFENWNFKELFEIGILKMNEWINKIIIIMKVIMIK